TRIVPVVEPQGLHILTPGMKLGAVRVGKKLGAGNMGIVYLGHHEALDRAVVVKTLSPQRLMGDGSAEVIARFYEEARSVARLSHQNIAQIFDVGRHKGFHYLIMEFVDGCSLGDYLKTNIISLEEKICLVLGVASGLGAAHKCGVVHRDIKPDNIMINQEGQAKIVDFGLAKRHGSAGLTSDQTVLGTPYFMAPEQCDGRDIDGRADLYALGVTAFWMFTGEYPFNGKHPVQVIMARLRQAAPLIQKINPTIPPSLAKIVNRLLLADPEERYQSARELIHAISKLSLTEKASGSGSAGKVAFRAVERSDRPLSKSNPIENPNAWPWLLAGGAALILLVSLTGFVIVRNKIRAARDLGASQAEEKLKSLEEKKQKEVTGQDRAAKDETPPKKEPKPIEKNSPTPLKDWPVPTEVQERLLNKLAGQLKEGAALHAALPKNRGSGKWGKKTRLLGELGRKIRQLGIEIGSVLGEFYQVSKIDNLTAFNSWVESAFRWEKKSWTFNSISELEKPFRIGLLPRNRTIEVDGEGARVTGKRGALPLHLLPAHATFKSARFQFKLTRDETPKYDFILSIERAGYTVVITSLGYYITHNSDTADNKGSGAQELILATVMRRGIFAGKNLLKLLPDETLTIFLHHREDGVEWIVKDSDSIQRFLLPKQGGESRELLLKVGSSARLLSLDFGEKNVGNP
ncbi:MAG: serine/threonine-protein kinase, partial [Planctomycetota bacterium]|nr:serine/threonine-protein kinase [Planctomycetota bacterium]